ncbi:hypothetical protein BGZ75_004794 [Mortierella antarctica]|nr:hypothetical protein BGZ75_004794 [Mortierella antarctica]
MADPNPLFDDFLDLSLLGAEDPTNDLFSFLLNNEDFNPPAGLADPSPIDLSALEAFSALSSFDTMESPAVPKDEVPFHDKQEEQKDLQFLLAHNLHQQQQQQQQQQHLSKDILLPSDRSEFTALNNADNDALVAQLTSPSPLASASPSTGVIAALLSAIPTAVSPPPVVPETISATTPAEATAHAQIAALIDTSKTVAAAAIPSTAMKRPSPEPFPAARKQARTGPAATKPSVSVSTSAAPLTSTINTTLSAATLQFLLQQQMQTPLVPHLFTGKLTREEIEETLARLLESTKHLIQSSPETSTSNEDAADSDAESDEMDGVEGHGQPGHSCGLKTQPGIKTDDIPSQKELKKMTSKERRQLRNKISARNFRVRRKEYIGTLEEQVEQHKTEARHLREAVVLVHDENKRLKEELERFKRQLTESTIANASSAKGSSPQQHLSTTSAVSLSNEDQKLLTAILGRSPLNSNANRNLTLSMPRSQSPILPPNLKKDVSNSSSIHGSSWKDKTPFFVHTALLPEIRLIDQLQFGPKAAWSKEDEMWDRPWLSAERTPKELSKEDKNPFLVSRVVYELMSSIATSMTMNLVPDPETDAKVSRVTVEQDDKAQMQDYESDRQIGETLSWEMQQDLWVQAQLKEQSALAGSFFSDDNSSRERTSQGDPRMLEWLYESLVARMVDMDLRQAAQDQQRYLPFSEVHFA